MKYLTPARLVRLGNLDDREDFLAAMEDWEDALSAYGARFEAIKSALPPDLRSFYDVYLHDAGVLSMHRLDDELVITLQPYTLPDRLVVVRYELAGEPVIQTERLPPERCMTCVLWGYDEVDLDAVEAGRQTFRHDVLLSNGWELAIRFRSVSVARPLRVLPAGRAAAVSEKSA